MDFETRAIHVGQEPDPATGAVDRADLPDLDLRPGGGRRPQGLRLLAHRQPDAARARGVPRLARGRRATGSRSRPAWRAITTVLHLLSPGDRVVSVQRRLRRARTGSSRKRVRAQGLPVRARPSAGRRQRRARGALDATDADGLDRVADQSAAERRRHRARPPMPPARPALCASSTTRSRRPSSSGRSRSAPISSCTRRRSTSAATPTSSAASSRRADQRARRAPRLPARTRWAPCRGRSTPGSCSAASRRSRCACAGTARMRARSPRWLGRAPRRRARQLSRAADPSRSTSSRAGRCATSAA